MFDFIKEIYPGVLTAIVIAIVFWLVTNIKKLIKTMAQVSKVGRDVKDIKELQMYQLKRLDAQDSATAILFQCLKQQKVNGEACEAIDFMKKAKQESDDFVSRLLFASNGD